MSKPVVLIPAWRRPEFLWHCLENIKNARQSGRYHYVFRFDQGHSPELFQVIDGFPFSYEVTITQRSPYRVAKQSFSLLTGYQIAAQRAGREQLVFMIEEDVMIAQDFFEWHEAIHAEQKHLWCSIGVANPNRKVNVQGEGGDYYLTSDDYCSLGVCYKASVINDVIIPLATPKYFVDPINHLKREFPASPFGDAFAEQDGLIRRAQWAKGMAMPIAYPVHAKAYHAGFYGKNRGAGFHGSLQERKQRIAEVIYSDEAMRMFARHPEWYEDSRPINLTGQQWTSINERTIS